MISRDDLWDQLFNTPYGLLTAWDRALATAFGEPGAPERPEGFDPLWFRVLQIIQDEPEQRLRLQDLAAKIHHSPSGTTRLVDRMEARGLVRRHECTADRRATWAMAEARGVALYRWVLPHWEAFSAAHLESLLSAEDREHLARILSRLRKGPAGAGSCLAARRG